MKKNVFLWILAIIIALGLWFQQRILRHQQAEFEIPVVISNLAPKFKVTQKNFENTRWQISGKGLHLLIFKFSSVFAEIDASNFTYGTNFIKKNNDENLYLAYPDWLNIKYKLVNENLDFSIEIDEIVTEKKQIASNFLNTPELRSYTISPEFKTVNVTGTKSDLNSISYIYTAFSEVNSNSNEIWISLVKPNFDVKLDPKKIKLTKRYITPKVKTISFIKIFNPKKLRIMPETVSVKISGKSLKDIDENSIKPYFDYDKNKTEFDIKFKLPDSTKVIDFTPKKIRIINNG